MEKTNKRYIAVDIMKGIGIVVVMIYHLVYRQQDGFADHLIRSAIWLFMPLYFIISGYLSDSKGRTVPQQLLRKVKNILVPVVISCCILLVLGGIYCVLFHDFTMTDWIRDVVHTFLRPEFSEKLFPEWGTGGILFLNISPVWFIWTMMWAELLFIPLADKVISDEKKTGITAVILILIQIPLYICIEPLSWSLNLVPIYVVCMLVGARVREGNVIERLDNNKIPAWASLLFAAGILVLHVYMYYQVGLDWVYAGTLGTTGPDGGRGWMDVLIFPIQAMLGGIAIYAISDVLAGWRKIGEALAWVGRHSLAFLCYHCAYGVIAADLLHTYIKPGQYWFVDDLNWEIIMKSWAGFLFALICCIIHCVLKDKVKHAWEARKEEKRKEKQNAAQ